MNLVGVATVDITPPPGLLLCGYAARTEPALGAHDALTVRALVVDDTAVVTVDVIGLHEASCERIRRQSALPNESIVIAAVHNHAAPASMPGRLAGTTDAGFLAQLEQACIDALREATDRRLPCRLQVGMTRVSGIASNRRHAGGPVDDSLPVARFDDAQGRAVAVVVSFACHPVVLGADNRYYSADYPHYVRSALETALPGSTALFLTGAAGDINTGHSAQASMSLAGDPTRTVAEAQRIGERLAAAALATPLRSVEAGCRTYTAVTPLSFTSRESTSLDALVRDWDRERHAATAARRALLDIWLRWSATSAREPLAPWTARISLLDWGGLTLLALPGEIFAETGLALREAMHGDRADDGSPAIVMIAAYADGNPGYIPPVGEYRFGGYEIDEAHRYYGFPATFAPGSAETLLDTALSLYRDARAATGEA